MPNISFNQVPYLAADNKLYVTALYNDESACSQSNQQAIAPYLSIPGLPSLSEPIAGQNAMAVADSSPIGNGNVIVMPPGVCFKFNFGFLCQLGFEIKVTLLPTNEVIMDNHFYTTDSPTSTPDYLYGNLPTWNDGKTITIADEQFASAQPGLSPEQQKYVENSYQIKFEAWPVTSFESPEGTEHTIPSPATSDLVSFVETGPSAVFDEQKLTVNTHYGTVGQGKQSTTKYGTIWNAQTDKSQTVTLVFDMLVMNEKYYSKENAEVFTHAVLSD